MKIDIRKFAKKFNLEILQESIANEELNVIEFSGINSINNRECENVAAVILPDTNISKSIDSISLVIVCKIDKPTKKQIEKLLKYKKPILFTKFSKREMVSILDSYALKKQSTPERIHATMLSIFGEGILITGKSGIGKSELALELINRKHLFVGDDAIDIISLAGKPMGKAPTISRDFIEVRGVGIMNVRGMFGIQSMIKEHKVDLIIELVYLADVKSSIERLGKEYTFRTISGVEIPLIQIPLSPGRSVVSVVEAATIAFKQRTYNNYIAADELTLRHKKS